MDPARSHPASFPQTDHSEAEGQFQQQTVLAFGSTLFPGQSPAGGLGINSILCSSLSFSLLSSFINLSHTVIHHLHPPSHINRHASATAITHLPSISLHSSATTFTFFFHHLLHPGILRGTAASRICLSKWSETPRSTSSLQRLPSHRSTRPPAGLLPTFFCPTRPNISHSSSFKFHSGALGPFLLLSTSLFLLHPTPLLILHHLLFLFQQVFSVHSIPNLVRFLFS